LSDKVDANKILLQIKEKRLHVPLVDRLPDEPPPRLVTIVGPPGVGKTTLLWDTSPFNTLGYLKC
jgi:predicted AAA+ superfamily ATPase